MPEMSNSLPKRKAPTFKPPRPASKVKSTPTTGTCRRKSAPARAPDISSSASSEVREHATVLSSLSSSSSSSDEQERGSSSNAKEVSQNPPPLIPPKLLARILHHHFEGEDQQVSREAIQLVGKYMDTFVREAIARATFERAEAGGGAVGSDFLEVRMPSLC